MNLPVLKDRIQEMCKSSGVSQKHLCDLLGKDRAFLSNVFRGNCTINGEQLAVLANELRTSPAYLLGEIDTPAQEKKKPASDAELKVALFGGDGEVTDEMWDEVVRFAEFVKSKHSKGDK